MQSNSEGDLVSVYIYSLILVHQSACPCVLFLGTGPSKSSRFWPKDRPRRPGGLSRWPTISQLGHLRPRISWRSDPCSSWPSTTSVRIEGGSDVCNVIDVPTVLYSPYQSEHVQWGFHRRKCRRTQWAGLGGQGWISGQLRLLERYTDHEEDNGREKLVEEQI